MSPERVVEDGEASISEAQQTNNGGGNEHVCVEPQPSEVQRKLDTEVFLNLVYRLIHDPSADLRPLRVQQMSQ
jgi:hypothetical protein